jgi:putative heme-binding domain-containing protein
LLGQDDESGLEALAALLVQVDDASVQSSLLEGMHEALRGRRNVGRPPSWPQAYAKLAASADESVRDRALALALIFGDPQALESMRTTMLDGKAAKEKRELAIGLLVQSNAPKLAPDLQRLLVDKAVCGAALRGLAAYDHADTPRLILAHYAGLTDAEKQDALTTLATRREYASTLLDAVAAKQIAPRDISAFCARQIENLGDARLTQRLTELWGAVRQTSEERQAQIARLKQRLDDELLVKADLASGHKLFQKTCAQCHMLYGEGSKIGPDITGSNRDNLDYILENVVDPSAAVPRAYRMTTFAIDDGRVISGLVAEQTARTITVQTVNGVVVVDRSTIEAERPSEVSMMPDGIFDKLTADEIRDLVGYLRTKTPPPEGRKSEARNPKSETNSKHE